MQTVSERVSEKAARLISEGKVSRVKGHVYRVEGDSDSYTVMVGYPQEVSGRCDCPAQGLCSHLIAACAYELANPSPVDLTEGMVLRDRIIEAMPEADRPDPFKGII